MKFPSHLNCDGKIVSEMGPRPKTYLMHNTKGLRIYGTVCGLTHWGLVSHICVGKLTIIGSDNGLSPGRRQAIIWTNAGILLIGPLGTNFSEMTEIFIEIYIFSYKKMHLNMSGKWWPFFLGFKLKLLS